jgi:c-di-GMP-binding flagellar brake protein YcgR
MKRPPAERRRAPRIKPFVARCRLRIGTRSQAAYLTDLSTGGAQLSGGGAPPAEGSTLVVEVRLRPDLGASRLPARVLWSQRSEDEGFVVGISFVKLGEEERRTLQAVVEEYQRRASELA